MGIHRRRLQNPTVATLMRSGHLGILSNPATAQLDDRMLASQPRVRGASTTTVLMYDFQTFEGSRLRDLSINLGSDGGPVSGSNHLTLSGTFTFLPVSILELGGGMIQFDGQTAFGQLTPTGALVSGFHVRPDGDVIELPALERTFSWKFWFMKARNGREEPLLDWNGTAGIRVKFNADGFPVVDLGGVTLTGSQAVNDLSPNFQLHLLTIEKRPTTISIRLDGSASRSDGTNPSTIDTLVNCPIIPDYGSSDLLLCKSGSNFGKFILDHLQVTSTVADLETNFSEATGL